MLKRWIISVVAVVSLGEAATLRAQREPLRQSLPDPAAALGALVGAGRPTVNEIAFMGLRRISPEALKRQLVSRAGDALDAAKIEHDVRVLARTGWFATVRAEVRAEN